MKPVDYWTLIEPVWLRLNYTWDDLDLFVREFQSVQREIGHLYAGNWCQSEVVNGGFHQFFSNTTGLLAPEAVEGFRAIGVVAWAEILAEAMWHFGTPYPRDRDERGKFLPHDDDRPREQWDPFTKLDERFYACEYDWEAAADEYAIRAITGGRG
jgi:hypothetical protein